MISQQAKNGFGHIFVKAAKSHLILNAEDACDIIALPEMSLSKLKEKKLLVLTISSFLFRLVTIFHFNENQAARDYFKKGVSGETVTDVLSEIGNLCCGAINRDLLHHVSHLGMSTPYVLDSQCLPFLNELKPGFVTGYEININRSLQMHATLCVCAYAPIDFSVDMSAVEETTGELELF